MKHIIFLIACLYASGVVAQTPMETVLATVERDNLRLKAERDLAEAGKAEARVGNTLPNPSVSYDYLWGPSREAGNSGELNVVQGFELPNVYVARSRYARSQDAVVDAQYAAMRSEILHSAVQCVIELDYLRSRGDILEQNVDNARRMSAAYSRLVETGEASLLESNYAAVEFTNAMNAFKANNIDIFAAESLLGGLMGGDRTIARHRVDPGPLPALPSAGQVRQLWEQAHPQVVGATAAARAAERQVAVSRGEALPQFEVGFRSEHALGERFSGIKMGMTIPLFESRNTVRLARARQAAAQAAQQDVRMNTSIEADRLRARAAMLLESYKRSVEALEKADERSLAGRAFDAGQINLEQYINRMNSQSVLEEAKLAAERDYRLAVAELLAPGL